MNKHFERAHMKSKHEICQHCTRATRDMKRHLPSCWKYLRTKNMFKCRGCRCVCSSAESLEQHMLSCNEVRTYQCHICGTSLTTEHSLKDHLKVHGKPGSVQCDKCGKTVKENNLEKHLARVHKVDKPCKACGTMTPGGYHDSKICPVKRKYVLSKCPYCNLESKAGKGAIKRHVACKHPDFLQEFISKEYSQESLQEFACNNCGKMYMSYFSLEKHQEVCGKELPYKCGNCRQGFDSLSNLKRHMQTCDASQYELVYEEDYESVDEDDVDEETVTSTQYLMQ